MAASVVERLRTPAFGLGGDRLAAAGVDLVAHVRSVSSMGAFPVLRRSLRIAGALGGLIQRLRRHRPSAALLVGFSEVNARLGPMLRRRSVPVLWYCPPQVWAWRAARARTLARACDRMAVVLPFEEPLWRDAGARATYVGHPAFELVGRTRTDRAQTSTPRVALLPGSRDAEVRRHLPLMLEAVAQRARHAELVLAESLSPEATRWARSEATKLGIHVSAGLARTALAGCDAALAASGTATLECVAAGVPPVIIYRTDPLTWMVAKHSVTVPWVALPNIVLGERAFIELLQRDATATALAGALDEVLGAREHYRALCSRVRTRLRGRPAPSARVADMIAPWLAHS